MTSAQTQLQGSHIRRAEVGRNGLAEKTNSQVEREVRLSLKVNFWNIQWVSGKFFPLELTSMKSWKETDFEAWFCHLLAV